MSQAQQVTPFQPRFSLQQVVSDKPPDISTPAASSAPQPLLPTPEETTPHEPRVSALIIMMGPRHALAQPDEASTLTTIATVECPHSCSANASTLDSKNMHLHPHRCQGSSAHSENISLSNHSDLQATPQKHKSSMME